MDRRSFFRTMVGGVATAAAVRQWPFRVYSFPSKPEPPSLYGIAYYEDIHSTQWLGLKRYPIRALKLENICAELPGEFKV